MRVQRILDLPSLLKNKSYFLFGPRGTAKSFLIQLQQKALVIDLLRSEFIYCPIRPPAYKILCKNAFIERVKCHSHNWRGIFIN